MARCTECGATIKEASKFCEYCGARIKLSELESVLSFHEDRDKRNLEAKRREADAARAAKAANEKRALKILLVWFVVWVLGFGFLWWDEYYRVEPNTTAMPVASREFDGRNYQDVKTDLQAAGFTSLETSAVPDLKLGLLKKSGEVEEVSVNGRTDFSADDRFPTGARIIIRYHTFPEK